MPSYPVWQICHQIHLPVTDELSCISEIWITNFYQSGLPMLHAKFGDNWTKFVWEEANKFKMANFLLEKSQIQYINKIGTFKEISRNKKLYLMLTGSKVLCVSVLISACSPSPLFSTVCLHFCLLLSSYMWSPVATNWLTGPD